VDVALERFLAWALKDAGYIAEVEDEDYPSGTNWQPVSLPLPLTQRTALRRAKSGEQ
jgi:hypothetical protein